MVIWIIGMAGAGKTTLGREVHKKLKEERPNTVFLDGDLMRALFNHDQDESCYTPKGRKLNALRIRKMCRFLDEQGIDVVCCILSNFPEDRIWNRKNYSSYFEVFVDVPMDILVKRDQKNLYSKAISGEIKNVIGVDIPFKAPTDADYVFSNSEPNVNFFEVASDLLKKAKESKNAYLYCKDSLVIEPNTYFYSAYEGESFLKGWKESRLRVKRFLGDALEVPLSKEGNSETVIELLNQETIASGEFLDQLYSAVLGDHKSVEDTVFLLIKKFEVTKRIFERYLKGLKGDKESSIENFDLYLRAAEIFEVFYAKSKSLPALNALLKILDTLCSVCEELSEGQKGRLSRLIEVEDQFIQALRAREGVTSVAK